MVCEPFADGAAQVRSPIHTLAPHLVRKPFGMHMYMKLYAPKYVLMYNPKCKLWPVAQVWPVFQPITTLRRLLKVYDSLVNVLIS